MRLKPDIDNCCTSCNARAEQEDREEDEHERYVLISMTMEMPMMLKKIIVPVIRKLVAMVMVMIMIIMMMTTLVVTARVATMILMTTFSRKPIGDADHRSMALWCATVATVMIAERVSRLGLKVFVAYILRIPHLRLN